ncbi:DUF2061 domain-containing protein [Portibacter lacus]|uniref:DUF2061 domain-containing protein n=1 Tax=Portibacter lacus TaxID=1099794 RepID=A0AA37WFP4_9BACT|nr:DUF2061 domain-containing protein [Portibacter lacus]GLR18837.1 hypothetical protein GCM10007940_34530 [Portibacter lacus]
MTRKHEYVEESHLRSIVKGITWRIIASTTILIITYMTTGEMDTAITIASIEFFVKLLLYYLHERAWIMLPRGTLRKLLGIKKEKDA